MKRVFTFLFAVVVVFAVAVQAQAELTVIGQAQYSGQNFSLIWDNNSPFGSIVWLDYTKYGENWQNQVNWAAGLNSGGVLTYNIDPLYSVTWGGNWRLPSTVDGPSVDGYDGTTTAGFNITSSEMGHLFYTELGNKGFYSTTGVFQPDYGLINKGPFTNLIEDYFWSGTQYEADTNYAWIFGTVSGHHDALHNKIDYPYYAIAVRPGDVSVVPEPMSMILFGVGATVLGARRLMLRRHG